MPPPTPGRLHTLPAEMRLEIYELVVVDSEASPNIEPPLMQTCKTIRAEMIPTYLKHLDARLKEHNEDILEAQAPSEAAKDWASRHVHDPCAALRETSCACEYENALLRECIFQNALRRKNEAMEREDLRTVSIWELLGVSFAALWRVVEVAVRLRVYRAPGGGLMDESYETRSA